MSFRFFIKAREHKVTFTRNYGEMELPCGKKQRVPTETICVIYRIENGGRVVRYSTGVGAHCPHDLSYETGRRAALRAALKHTLFMVLMRRTAWAAYLDTRPWYQEMMKKRAAKAKKRAEKAEAKRKADEESAQAADVEKIETLVASQEETEPENVNPDTCSQT